MQKRSLTRDVINFCIEEELVKILPMIGVAILGGYLYISALEILVLQIGV